MYITEKEVTLNYKESKYSVNLLQLILFDIKPLIKKVEPESKGCWEGLKETQK